MKSFRSFGLPVRLLLVNQLGVNLGFYLLVPFLAGYLDDLGIAAVVVGLVLGVRTLSQQGLFLFGGTAADRLGCRGVIIAGCALRAVGFGLFGVFDQVTGLVVAAVLSGVAGALFSPAVRAYIAVEAGDRRVEAFALFNVFANAGALAGPLLGAALLGVGFPTVAAVAAAVFAVLTIAQVAALPARPVPQHPGSVWRDWAEVVTNQRFLGFALAASGAFALQNQLYLAIPLAAEQATGTRRATAGVFALATVAGLLGQMRVTAWCRARWSSARSVAVGLGLMGVAFLVPVVTAGGRGVVAAGVLAVSVLVLSLGYQVAQPFIMDLVPSLGSEALPGTYFGVFYLMSGVAAAAASTLTGALWDNAYRWIPWLPLAALGFAGAVGVRWLDGRGALATVDSQPVASGGGDRR